MTDETDLPHLPYLPYLPYPPYDGLYFVPRINRTTSA